MEIVCRTYGSHMIRSRSRLVSRIPSGAISNITDLTSALGTLFRSSNSVYQAVQCIPVQLAVTMFMRRLRIPEFGQRGERGSGPIG